VKEAPGILAEIVKEKEILQMSADVMGGQWMAHSPPMQTCAQGMPQPELTQCFASPGPQL
jgi:hypothetical protein